MILLLETLTFEDSQQRGLYQNSQSRRLIGLESTVCLGNTAWPGSLTHTDVASVPGTLTSLMELQLWLCFLEESLAWCPWVVLCGADLTYATLEGDLWCCVGIRSCYNWLLFLLADEIYREDPDRTHSSRWSQCLLISCLSLTHF